MTEPDTRFRRIYFDCDIFDASGQLLEQNCSCVDVAPGTSDFEAWAETVGKETTSALLTDTGEPCPTSLRLVVQFTHWYYLAVGKDGRSVGDAVGDPILFPNAWTPDTAEIYAEYGKSLAVIRSDGFCEYGKYPWDYWQQVALKSGVREDVATTGREVMREASQHAWIFELSVLCGWADYGSRMIKLALRSPERAKARWNWLLETDGERVDPETHEWMEEYPSDWSARMRKFYRSYPARNGAEA